MNRLTSLLCFFLLACLLDSGRSSATKSIAEGEEWLNWGDDTKMIYLLAYLQGYDRGFSQGCKTAQKAGSISKAAGLPGEKCLAHQPGYPESLEYYATKITEYYRTYSTDRYVTIRTVLDGLSSARNLTLQAIHSYNGPRDTK
jgi:hypothetical protein